MSTAGYGLRFKETMIGYLASSGGTGKESIAGGDLKGDKIEVRIEMSINHLDDFMASSAPSGEVNGCIDFLPLGESLEISGGRFSIFPQVTAADTGFHVFMVYEFPFKCAFRQYYLRFDKILRRANMLRLWMDTTAFNASLYSGLGGDSQLIASGVLNLRAIDFLRLLSSIRVSGSRSGWESLSVIAKFVAFFLIRLWKIYGVTD